MLHPETEPTWQTWYDCKYHGEFYGIESEQPTKNSVVDCPTCETAIQPNRASNGETEISF